MTVTQGGPVRRSGPRDAERQPGPADPVRAIMSRQLHSVPPEASLREAARELADNEIGAVLVETSGGPVGLVSERDVVAAVAAGEDPEDRQVADVMTTDLVTARPADPVAAVAALIREAGVRHVPVLDGARVVGIVSVRDVLTVLLRGRS
jgi:CBS domain-containing protein